MHHNYLIKFLQFTRRVTWPQNITGRWLGTSSTEKHDVSPSWGNAAVPQDA